MSHHYLHVLAICGSLRKESYNKQLLSTAIGLAPEDMQINTFDISGIPVFNQDVEAEGDPESVVALKKAITESDAILFATPEYNYSVPGVLKNAIDWASRPPFTGVMNGKPVGLIGASIGMSGTIRAQLALRQSFVFINCPCMPQPEVTVPNCMDKFDGEKLTDEASREIVQKYMAAFADWARRFK